MAGLGFLFAHLALLWGARSGWRPLYLGAAMVYFITVLASVIPFDPPATKNQAIFGSRVGDQMDVFAQQVIAYYTMALILVFAFGQVPTGSLLFKGVAATVVLLIFEVGLKLQIFGPVDRVSSVPLYLFVEFIKAMAPIGYAGMIFAVAKEPDWTAKLEASFQAVKDSNTMERLNRLIIIKAANAHGFVETPAAASAFEPARTVAPVKIPRSPSPPPVPPPPAAPAINLEDLIDSEDIAAEESRQSLGAGKKKNRGKGKR